MPRNRSLRLAALGSTVQRAAAPAYSTARARNALRRRVVAGVLVALSLILITGYFRESDNGALHGVQGATASVLRPFQLGAERVARPFQDGYDWVAGFFHAKSENEALRQQLQALRQQAIQNMTAAQEYRELRNALKFRSGPMYPSDYEQVAAEVISYGANEFQQQLVISAGRSAGIRLNDPVTDSQGFLVGHISKTTSKTAEVSLLTDGDFSVAGRDAYTGTYGLVSHGQGAGETLILDLVPKDKVIRENDLIVTAGRQSARLPSLYPRNIAIGVVTSVGQTDVDIHQAVQIAPLADFSSLNVLLVLVPKDRS